MTITPGELDDPRVAQLLMTHRTTARAQTAPESAHALDLLALQSRGIRLWAAWHHGELLGTAALKHQPGGQGQPISAVHRADLQQRRRERGCVVVHCGPYERRGLAPTFVSRREVLRPNQPLEFELPPGGWARSQVTEPQEMMISTTLPAGRYPIWATFKLATADATLTSDRDTYVVTPPPNETRPTN